MERHKVVSRSVWIEARRELLAREKEFTRLRDALSAERRAFPWVEVTKEFIFDGEHGRRTLLELFEGRSQLLVYHFMFAPEWDEGCPHCSFWADGFNGIIVHLAQRDVSMVAVSRAPYAKLASYRKRMGWSFPWFSSGQTDFNFDYHASFTPADVASKRVLYNFVVQDMDDTDREGISVFCRDEQGKVFHTYSTYARGIDLMNAAYNYLDLVPKGRDEGGRGPYWVRRHDQYDV